MKKIYNYIIEIILVLLILIPNIKAENMTQIVDTSHYSNYYYFFGAFNYGNRLGSTYYTVPTTNKGIFAPPELGYNSGLNCTIVSISDYIGFFEEYNNVFDSGRKDSTIYAGASCDISWSETKSGETSNNSSTTLTKNKTITRRYTHGCYTQGSSVLTSLEGKVSSPLVYGCASFDKTAHVGFDVIENSTSNDYLELTITRDEGGDLGEDDNFDRIEGVSTSYSSHCYRPTVIEESYDPPRYYIDENGEQVESKEDVLYRNTHGSYIYSPVLGNCTYDVTDYSCKGNPNISAKAECNGSANINRSCENKTFINYNNDKKNSRAEVRYTQKGTISNILTTGNDTNTIHQGGGIMISFMYQNTVEYEIKEDTIKTANGESKETAIKKINNKMKNSIKSGSDLANEINATITLKDEKDGDILKSYNKDKIQVECYQNYDNFDDTKLENKIYTTCTVMLPATKLEDYTGKVIETVDFSEEKGVNNKTYTSITYSGKINVSASISGLSVIKTTGGELGGITGDELDKWKVDFSDGNNGSCTVNVEDRFYKADGSRRIGVPGSGSGSDKVIRKPLYRPIDINDPFPNRIAGVNWLSWYQEHPNRLSESYTVPQYSIELSPIKISQIKNNYNSNYLDWDEIDKNTEESKFVSEMFTGDKDYIRRNIKDDDSQ